MQRKLHLCLAVVLLAIGLPASAQKTYYVINYDFDTTYVDGVFGAEPLSIPMYEADITSSTRSYVGLDTITGWTPVDGTGTPVTTEGLAGGILKYGTGAWIDYTTYTVPSTSPNGTSHALALAAAIGGNTVQYTSNQVLTLMPGEYTMSVWVYNSSGEGKDNIGTANVTNLIGLVDADGNFVTDADEADIVSSYTTYELDQWTEDVITFTIATPTTAYISLGYTSPASSSFGAPHLFIDQVTITNASFVTSDIAGNYYLRTLVDGEYKYLTEGADWATRAIVADPAYATPFVLTSYDAAEGTFLFAFPHNECSLYGGYSASDIWCDRLYDNTFYLAEKDGEYAIMVAGSVTYYGYFLNATGEASTVYSNSQGSRTGTYVANDGAYADAFVWELVEIEDFYEEEIDPVYDQAIVDQAEPWGLVVETADEVLSFLDKLSTTSYTLEYSYSSVTEHWGGSYDMSAINSYDAQTVTLDNGYYKLSANAFQRIGGNADDGYNLRAPIYLRAFWGGDDTDTVRVLIPSVYDEPNSYDYYYDYTANGGYICNNVTSAGIAFSNGQFENELYFYVEEDGTEITIDFYKYVYGQDGDNWLCWQDFTLERYDLDFDYEITAVVPQDEEEVGCLYVLEYTIANGENDIDAVYPNYDYEDDIVVYDSEGNVVTTGSLLSISGSTFTIQLDEVVDDYGTYTVEIPAYLFGDDDADKSGFASGHANPTTTFTYTITADKAHEGFSIDPIDVAPEEGKTYGSLDGFTLSSETGTLSLNGSEVATLYDGDGNAVATGTLTANEDGSISIELDETIVASGVYTLVIPREALKVTDTTVDLNESVLVYKLQYVYVVDGSCNITFDPEEEVTYPGALSVITATFNEVDAVIVESNNEYIEGAYFYIYSDAECTTKVTKADGTDNYAYVTPNVFGDSSQDPGKTYSKLNDVENPSNVLTLTLAEEITEAGTYYIVIDTDDGKHADETTVLLYNWDASTTTNGGWTESEMQQDYVAVFVIGIVAYNDITLTSADPEDEASVAVLSEILIAADESVYLNPSLSDYGITLTLGSTTYTPSSVYNARGSIGIEFDEAITDAGQYTLNIPAGVVCDLDTYSAILGGSELGEQHFNAEASFTYTVTGPYEDYTITPSVGTYNALSEFTLSNSTGTIVFNWWGYNPYILDSEGTKTYIKGDDYLTQNEDGSITLTLADEIVAAGTYTLVIPSYCISVGNDGTEGQADSDYETVTYDITYNYVVDGTLNVTFDPEDGSTVQGLDEITVTFNDMETVTCEGTMIGVNETYYYIYTDETLENKVFQSNGNANYAVATTSSTDANTLVLTLAEDITEEGTYYIVITGSNTILNGGDLELTEDIVASFTIYDPYKLYLDIEVEASDPTAGDVEYVESSILFHVVSDIAVYIVNDANYDASGIIVYDADGNAVTYGTALTMEEGIANYFTVELADVITENGDYTIVLPEAIVGDEDADRTSFAYGHANYEQSFTFSVTPKYYFKVAGEYQYLQRAGNWGTELTLGSVGTLFTKVDEDSTFYLTTSDAVAAGSSNIYVTGPTSAYVDASSGAASWSLEDAGDGTYYIVNSNGNYLCGSYYEDTSYGYAYYYIGEATSTDDAPAFELISRTEYIESLSARLDDQAATAAAAAGLSATTVEELEAAVAEYEATDVAISYDDFAAIYTNGATGIYAAAAISDPTIEVYNGCGGAEQTISGLAAGLYKVTLNAMSRAFLISSYESNAALAGFSSDAAFIYANDAVDQTAFYGDYEDYLDVNSISDFISAAEEGAYEKTLYVYVADGEDLTIGFEAPYRTNYEASWTITGNWTVTLLADVDTSISSISINADGTFEPTAVYSVSGQLIRTQATSLEGLPQGIYIVNGQKMLVK